MAAVIAGLLPWQREKMLPVFEKRLEIKKFYFLTTLGSLKPPGEVMINAALTRSGGAGAGRFGGANLRNLPRF